jgi:protocatechuate 3,4-dioxygenase beta subunit
MDRKKFLKALALASLIPVPFRLPGNVDLPGSGPCRTQRDAEGPYYRSDAPARDVIETAGTPLRIDGRIVRSNDCSAPLEDAVIDIWHCDASGNYDMKGFKCRGQVSSGTDGRYSFTTILPPPYGNRPRHIHFKVRAKGYPELTTQLYFHGDPNLKNDFARNAANERVITLASENDGLHKGVFDIYL